jgi:putative YphP/YqiW family bacilliredoxin
MLRPRLKEAARVNRHDRYAFLAAPLDEPIADKPGCSGDKDWVHAVYITRMSLYDERLVAHMRQELTRLGVEELRTADAVDAKLRPQGGAQGTTLVVVNSVCGCAARNARPAVARALQHETRPDTLTTVFAGQDQEATARARGYFVGYPPSSPSIALFKNGQLVFMLERYQIEGRAADDIARDLTDAFDRYCGRPAAV